MTNCCFLLLLGRGCLPLLLSILLDAALGPARSFNEAASPHSSAPTDRFSSHAHPLFPSVSSPPIQLFSQQPLSYLIDSPHEHLMLLPFNFNLPVQLLIELRLLGLLLSRVLILMIQSLEDGLTTKYVLVDQQRSALIVGRVHSSLINVLWECEQNYYQNTVAGMALRRDQKKRILPVIGIIKSCVQQSSREIATQAMINQGIVEELLQSDLLTNIQSLPAVKLILYQLILLVSQQNIGGRSNMVEEGSVTYGRISNVLLSIKDVLRDFSMENEEAPLKAIQTRNGKEFMVNQRTHRNRQKLLSTYYNQYCSLIEQLERYGGQEECQIEKERIGAEEALIDQLESLVFKKESVIENLQRHLSQQKSINFDLENQLNLIKYQHQALFQEKLQLEQQRLQEEIQSLARMQPPSEPCSSFIDAGKCFWSDSEEPTKIPRRQSEISEHDLLKCLISQALTIQALIQ